jgi:hypothetical protein
MGRAEPNVCRVDAQEGARALGLDLIVSNANDVAVDEADGA